MAAPVFDHSVLDINIIEFSVKLKRLSYRMFAAFAICAFTLPIRSSSFLVLEVRLEFCEKAPRTNRKR